MKAKNVILSVSIILVKQQVLGQQIATADLYSEDPYGPLSSAKSFSNHPYIMKDDPRYGLRRYPEAPSMLSPAEEEEVRRYPLSERHGEYQRRLQLLARKRLEQDLRMPSSQISVVSLNNDEIGALRDNYNAWRNQQRNWEAAATNQHNLLETMDDLWSGSANPSQLSLTYGALQKHPRGSILPAPKQDPYDFTADADPEFMRRRLAV